MGKPFVPPGKGKKARKRARIKSAKTRWIGARPMISVKDLQIRANKIINGIIMVTLRKLYHGIKTVVVTPWGYSLAHPDKSTETREWLIDQLNWAAVNFSEHCGYNSTSCENYSKVNIIFEDEFNEPTLRVVCDHCNIEVRSAIMTNVDPDWPTELAKMKADIPADITDLDLDVWKKKPKSEIDPQDAGPKGPISGSLDSIRELLRGGNHE